MKNKKWINGPCDTRLRVDIRQVTICGRRIFSWTTYCARWGESKGSMAACAFRSDAINQACDDLAGRLNVICGTSLTFQDVRKMFKEAR